MDIEDINARLAGTPYTAEESATPRDVARYTCARHGAFTARLTNLLTGRAMCCAREDDTARAGAAWVARAKRLHGDKYDYSLVRYVNATTHVDVQCREHGVFAVSPSNHTTTKPRGCPACANAVRGEKARARGRLASFDVFVANARITHDGSEYTYTSLDDGVARIVCPMHGEFTQEAKNHLMGHGCQKCQAAKHQARCDTDRAEAAARFSTTAGSVHAGKYDYTDFDYVDAKTKGTVVCPHHGAFQITPNNHLNGIGCARCTHRVSRAEVEMAEFVRGCGVVVEQQKPFGRFSVDLWIPALGIGIDHHGEWHHRDRVREGDGTAARRSSLHREKHDAVVAAGGRLIQLWGSDWANRRSQCERLIASALGVSTQVRVPARRCTVVRVTRAEAAPFLDANHLRGMCGPAVFFGLRDAGTLVAVAAFLRGTGGVELLRYATAAHVVGGCSRLVAAAQREWPGQPVFSFSDNMVSSGAMYAAMGFTKTNDGEPNYMMWSARLNRIFHRRLFRHTTIETWRSQYAPGVTLPDGTCRDKEEAMNVWRVWDAGLTRWELPAA